MGVPGLTGNLLPYSTTKIVTAQSTHKESVAEELTYLIIDGPALAYHVYNHCVADGLRSRSGLQALPTYAEIGNTAILFLSTLDTFGLRVDSIFFDGHLPEHKHQVRHERLEKSYAGLRKFRNATSGSLQVKPRQTHQQAPAGFFDSYKTLNSPQQSFGLPTLPLLVPVVLEALLRSEKYRTVTKVVPGEAEWSCKLRSKDIRPALILTNDSDLVILHPDCPVAFLRNFEFLPDRPARLRLLEFSPSEIARRLGGADFIKVAYHIATDPHVTLQHSANLVRKTHVSDQNKDYQKFRSSYSSQPIEQLAQYPLDSALVQVMQKLDPRISEVAIDVLFPSKSQKRAHMFLPPLIEDTSRASAWRPSFLMRRVAYAVLALCSGQAKVDIIEVDRKGDRPAEQNTQKEPPSETVKLLMDLSDYLFHYDLLIDSSLPIATSLCAKWCLVTTFQTLDGLICDSKLPLRQDIEVLFKAHGTQRLNSSALHFQAQVEGFLYSYRMLKQTLDVWLALKEDQASGIAAPVINQADPPSVQQSLMKLRNILDGLPPIRDLHIPPGQPFQLDSLLSKLLAKLDETCRVEESKELEAQNATSAPRTASKSSSQTDLLAKMEAQPSSNPFHLLQIEEYIE